MYRMRIALVFSMVLALTAFVPPVLADQDFEISCEGLESTGGGTYRYQYTLKNVSGGAVTLNEFFVGTQDPDISNYSFVPTAGFAVSIVANDAYPPCDVTYTTNLKTPHGVVPPIPAYASEAVIYWLGSALIADQGTITFAFNHPGCSQDQEWFANSDAGWTISQSDQPMAGPLGTFTLGYVHSPNRPVPATTNWGLFLLVGLVLAASVWVMLRMRKKAAVPV